MGTPSEAAERSKAYKDSRLLCLVFQPVFWYMRLSGFLVPMVCNCRLEPSATTHTRLYSSETYQAQGRQRNRQTLNDAELSSLKPGPTDNVTRMTPERRKSKASEERRLWFKNSRISGERCSRVNIKPTESSTGQTDAATKSVTPGNEKSKQVKWARSLESETRGRRGRGGTNNLEEQKRHTPQARTGKPELQGRRDPSSRSGGALMGIPEQQNGHDFSSLSESCEKVLEERRPGRCWKCRAVSVCTRFLYGFICLLVMFNAVRYSFIFYTTDLVRAYLVSAGIYQTFFVAMIFIYIFSSYDIAKLLPQIMEALLKFEKVYGTAVDCVKFRRRNLVWCGALFVLQVSFSLGFVILEQYVFPSLRTYLAPFDKMEGVAFYCALAGYAVTLFFTGSALYSLLGFLQIMTDFLAQEFNALGVDLREVLLATDDAAREAIRHRPSFREPREIIESGSSREKSLKDNAPFCRKSRTNPLKKNIKAPCTIVVTDDAVEDVEKDGDDFKSPGVTEGNDDEDNSVSVTTSKDPQTNESGRDGQSCVDREKTPDSCRGQSRCVRGKSRSTMTANVARENLRSPRSSHSSGLTSVLHEHQAHGDKDPLLNQEAAFDVLRLKHQELCNLLTLANRCLRHFVCIGLSINIPLVCIIIFALSSGALDKANVFFQVYNVLFSVIFLTFLVISGIRVNVSVRVCVCVCACVRSRPFLSVCLCLAGSVSLFVSVCVCLSICLSVCLSVSLSL